MGLTKKEYSEIRDELDSCKKPLFFFHGDADGLCAFLLLYRYKREGKGIIIKTTPKVDQRFTNKVKEYCPDKIFILDVALVDQDFINEVKTPIVCVDHHGPLKLHNVKYFNPRIKNPEDNTSVTEQCYNIVNQDMWIAMAGAVGDWQLPLFTEEFKEKYPDLLDKKIKRPEDALFDSGIGKLIDMIQLVLKGSTTDAMKCVKILTRINTPNEILKQETSKGRFIYKRYHRIKQNYITLFESALKSVSRSRILLFKYQNQEFSFTKELSNELLYRYPKKIIIIGREQAGEMKMSLRSKYKILPPILEKSLQGVRGYGGGHEHACGACIDMDDLEVFIRQIRENI